MSASGSSTSCFARLLKRLKKVPRAGRCCWPAGQNQRYPFCAQHRLGRPFCQGLCQWRERYATAARPLEVCHLSAEFCQQCRARFQHSIQKPKQPNWNGIAHSVFYSILHKIGDVSFFDLFSLLIFATDFESDAVDFKIGDL